MNHAKTLKRLAAAPFVAGLLIGSASTGIAAILGSSVFPDVTPGTYYDAAIGEMYGDGVITGYANGNFGPDDAVTRGQLALMLSRFKKELQGTVESSARSTSSRTTTSASSNGTVTSAVSSNSKGIFRFTTSTFSIPESTPTLNLSVIRSGGTQGDVTVDYAITAGTAGDADFNLASGTLSFDAGDTSKTIALKIKEDQLSEGSENLNVTLSNPGGGASLGSPSAAVVTILDNEASNGSNSSSSATGGGTSSNPNGTLNFNASGYGVMENGGSFTVTVSRTGGTTGAVGVTYATSNGTGQSGNEYTATSGTLSFAAGETSKTFTVAVNDDSQNDGSKTFNLALSAPTGGANIGSVGTATVSVTDNETVTVGSGSLKFGKSTYAVTEGSGVALLTVLRVGKVTDTISVNYSTTGLTASPGTDFTIANGTLTFAPNEYSKVISVTIIKDTNSDAGETFAVDLSGANPSSTPLLDPYSATVTIQ